MHFCICLYMQTCYKFEKKGKLTSKGVSASNLKLISETKREPDHFNVEIHSVKNNSKKKKLPKHFFKILF